MKHRRSKEGWKGWEGWSMHSRMPQATTAFALLRVEVELNRIESNSHSSHNNIFTSIWSRTTMLSWIAPN